MNCAAAVWFAVQEEVDRAASRNIPRSGLDSFDNDFLLKHFHFTRPAIQFIVDCVRDSLARVTRRSRALSVEDLVLAALSFYANGSLQRHMANLVGISQSSVSRAVATVSKVLADKVPMFVTFPSTTEDKDVMAQEFFKLCGITNILGIVGFMHMRIKAPLEDEYAFLNSKNYHSINCQMICDSHGNLLHLENHWPGGTPGSLIWEKSTIRQQFLTGEHGEYWLIGDSCYPLSKNLLTSVHYPVSPAEKWYNEAHSQAVDVIRQTFSALKARFRCLDNLGGNQKYTPARASDIISACCVLHNIAQKFSVGLPEITFLQENVFDNTEETFRQHDEEMVIMREKVIKALFSNSKHGIKKIRQYPQKVKKKKKKL
ncbi:putative nuclease HARBI1 [Erpetoichthys calabaricus]|uniref:Putative nuclease HARBI1 n=1 Tax=Erpetoichthys calabaricus TaxID=27687 RepID=A0A8C4RQJ2_ERPCA|nr:putative nuclease HARBI1 [Erpetoichthys calabaricus]